MQRIHEGGCEVRSWAEVRTHGVESPVPGAGRGEPEGEAPGDDVADLDPSLGRRLQRLDASRSDLLGHLDAPLLGAAPLNLGRFWDAFAPRLAAISCDTVHRSSRLVNG